MSGRWRDGDAEPLEAALGALNRREHSIAEIEAKLGERGFGREEIEGAIGELVLSGALDDARFARSFSADKRELSRLGSGADRRGLAERGISQELIDECCGGEDREELVERAVAMLDGARHPSLGDDRERNRALGFLTRRGFDYEVAHDAIRAARAA